MPVLYLSPSVREFIKYVDHGDEEYYMNLVADTMEPYLYGNGVSFTRNDPEKSLAAAISAANAGQYQLYLALHSNASNEGVLGKKRGAEVYYHPESEKSRKAAQIIARNYRVFYPYPQLVDVLQGENMREICQTEAPAVIIKTAYHDDPEDAQWVRDNIHNIGRSLAFSLTQYFGMPFSEPQTPKTAIVATRFSFLHVREMPKVTSPVIGKIAKGAYVKVYEEAGEWTVIGYGNLLGFAKSRCLTVI